MNALLLAAADKWKGVKPLMPDPAGCTPAVAVTGGSSGIGLAIARRFHAQGETVVLIARDEARLEAAKAAFPPPAPGTTARLHALALDVTAPDAPAAIEAALAQQNLFLDVLVNCAGTGLAGTFDTHSQAEIQHLLDLNIAAFTRLTRHALPAMKSRAHGGVLNVASLGGYVPGPNQAAYYASKAYVCSLTEALAAELSGSGVRMMVLAPGPVETRFHADMGANNSLYRWVLPALSPDRTARAAVTGYRLGRTVVVPGVIAQAIAVAVSLIPHWLTVPVVKLLLDTGSVAAQPDLTGKK